MVSSKTVPAEGAQEVKPEDQAKNGAKPETGDSKKPGAPQSGPIARRAPGAKEVIPFQWKLLGECRGVILTLFKAVEKDEVEAQYERLARDGYYGKLRITGAEEKIKQRASAKAALIPSTSASGKTKSKPVGSKRRVMAKWAKESGSGGKRIAMAIASATPVKATKKPKSAKTAMAGETAKATKATKTAKTIKTTKTAKPTKTAKASKAPKTAKSSKAAKSATSAKSDRKATGARTASKSRKKTVRAKSSPKSSPKSGAQSAAKKKKKK